MHGAGLSNPLWRQTLVVDGKEFVFEVGTLLDGSLIMKRPLGEVYVIDVISSKKREAA